MIFESLNNNVMLVELTGEEMEKFHITYDLLNENDEKTRIAIKKLLRKTDAQSRLERGDKVMVEALPTEDGGCFFIFTFSVPVKHRYKVKQSNTYQVFCAVTLDNFLDFISAVNTKKGIERNCNAYYMNNSYYLIIPAESRKISAVASEFGTISDFPITEILEEYGRSLGKIYLQ